MLHDSKKEESKPISKEVKGLTMAHWLSSSPEEQITTKGFLMRGSAKSKLIPSSGSIHYK
jgi:hypothetical protein